MGGGGGWGFRMTAAWRPSKVATTTLLGWNTADNIRGCCLQPCRHLPLSRAGILCSDAPCASSLPAGFIPYNQLAASTVQQGPAADLSYLVGKTLRAKVVSVSDAC